MALGLGTSRAAISASISFSNSSRSISSAVLAGRGGGPGCLGRLPLPLDLGGREGVGDGGGPGCLGRLPLDAGGREGVGSGGGLGCLGRLDLGGSWTEPSSLSAMTLAGLALASLTMSPNPGFLGEAMG